MDRMKKGTLMVIIFCFNIYFSSAQVPINSAEMKMMEDTVHGQTTVGGYGDAYYQRNNNEEVSRLNLERFVLFVGHKFDKKFSFFSELEVEDAKVSGGEEGGEIALEQCFIQYNLNPSHYFKFGLFIPQIGLLNQNHLPQNYYGNERNTVEQLLIPATWRELGITFIGSFSKIPLTYSFALLNGLNSASFEHGSGIRGGRFEGRNASGNNLAFNAACEYSYEKFKFQLSGYYGGSVGLSSKDADSLRIDGGFLGTPVAIAEANIRYSGKKFLAKALFASVTIPNAASINRVYENNTAYRTYGGYLEIAYQLCQSKDSTSYSQFFGFVRYEKLNLNAELPNNGISDPTLNQQYFVVGLSYLPIHNLVFKADVKFRTTDTPNPGLFDAQYSTDYKKRNSFINIGLGYSF